MAFTLTCSILERNDNKLLTITDTSGTVATGTATGWGAPNPEVTGITSILGGTPLTLDIVITTSDGTETTYDQIDLHETFLTGGHATVAALTFPLTMAHLKVSGVAAGTSADEFPDGIYEITYGYDSPAVSSVTGTVLLDGIVTAAIYQLLRTIPTKYECGGPHEKETLDIMFLNTYLSAMHASAYVAREESVLDQLAVIERLIDDVSTYTW